MIIHKPRMTEGGGEICVEAGVEIGTTDVDTPETLWFRFPRRYRDWVTDRADGFIVGLLPSAMSLGENVVVEGAVSPRLAFGLRQYQEVQNTWWPKRFRRVDVAYENLEATAERGPGNGVGSTFSGGIDSFYTLSKHMPAREAFADHRLTHCLIINGFDFDVDLENSGRFQRTFETFEPMLRNLGIEFLWSRTNLQQFRLAAMKKAPLAKSLEAPITASVLILGGLYSRFYLPSAVSYRYDSMVPGGGHPVVVNLLSTETTQVICDGADASRAEKAAVLSQWPETYSRLRVCPRPPVFNAQSGLIENCCRCEKCLRTMIALDMVDALPKYDTFPMPLRRRDVWRIKQVGVAAISFYKDNLSLARKVGRRDRVLDLKWARLRSRTVVFLKARVLGRRHPGR